MELAPEHFMELMLAVVLRPTVYRMYQAKQVRSEISTHELVTMHSALYAHSIIRILNGIPWERVQKEYNERMKFINALVS